MTDTTPQQAALIKNGEKVANRYTIIRNIGAGGMGAVYLVADEAREGKRMAMKVMHAQISTDKSYVSRFIREMELMEQIEHPNVVKVYDFGTFGSIIYFTMEYVEAHSLEHLLDHGTFQSKLIPHLIIGIADALEAIHAKDIIHRDLKPGNILISNDGKVKITDFGVARPLVSDLTMQNQKVGSIAYMAPEIWLSKQLTPAVDYYSVGVMLYEVVTGELPYPETDDLVEMMKMHTKRSIPAPNAIAKNIPGWLNKLIMRLLSKNPKARLKYAKKLIDDIRERFPDAESDFLSPYDTKDLGLVKSNVKERELTKLMQADPEHKPKKRRATVVLEMTATRNAPTEVRSFEEQSEKKRRRATVVIPLPKNAAVVLEFETPSTDFICFGVFLASLQVFDGILTAKGMDKFGIMMEGNLFLRNLMLSYGVEGVLLLVKFVAIVVVGLLTVVAKRTPWIKNMILFLSIVYLCAAIIPWLYLLYWRDILGL